MGIPDLPTSQSSISLTLLFLLFSAIVKVRFVEGSICTDIKRCHIHLPALAFTTFIIYATYVGPGVA